MTSGMAVLSGCRFFGGLVARQAKVGSARSLPQSGDEGVSVAVGAWKAEVQASGRAHDPGRDVEKARPQPLAAAGAERLGQCEHAHPAGDVVGESGGQPPHPVAEEVRDRGVVHAEVGLQLPDGFFGRPAAQAVVVLDG